MKAPYNKHNRQLILDFLATHEGYQFSVLEILEGLKKQGKKPNLTTVYRQLQKLVETNEVMQFSADNGTTMLFQLTNKDCTRHLHIRCPKCGAVSHLDCEEVNEFLAHISAEHHIEVNCKNSMLSGLCEKCRKHEPPPTAQRID